MIYSKSHFHYSKLYCYTNLVVFVTSCLIYFPNHLRSCSGHLTLEGELFGNRVSPLRHQGVLQHGQHIHGGQTRAKSGSRLFWWCTLETTHTWWGQRAHQCSVNRANHRRRTLDRKGNCTMSICTHRHWNTGIPLESTSQSKDGVVSNYSL